MGSEDIMLLAGVVAAGVLILFIIVADYKGWLDDGEEEDWGGWDD